MKTFQKITLTAITALAMNMSLSASYIEMEVDSGTATFSAVITGPV